MRLQGLGVIEVPDVAGLSRTRTYNTLTDSRLTTFEPIGRPKDHAIGCSRPRATMNLRDSAENPPMGTRFGIHTDGALFSLTETDTNATKLLPYCWDQLHRAAIRAGWAA